MKDSKPDRASGFCVGKFGWTRRSVQTPDLGRAKFHLGLNPERATVRVPGRDKVRPYQRANQTKIV